MFFLSKFCIVCLNTSKNLTNILIQDKNGILIQKKLKYCLPEIVDSHLQIPKYICINCLSLLDCFYKFKQWCLRNNTIMTNYLQTLTSADETYKYLSVSLTDIKSRNKQQAVSTGQTFPIVGSDDELRSEGKEDNRTYIKETEIVFKNKIKFRNTLDIRNSHPLFNEENDITVKEDFTFEDIGDFEFYHEFVKNIKYESIPSDSNDFVSDNEDVQEDSVDSNQSNENILTNHEENKNTVKNHSKESNKFQCFICSREFLQKNALKCHLKAHAVSKPFSKKVNQSQSFKVDNVGNCGSSNSEIDHIKNYYNSADLVLFNNDACFQDLIQLPEDNPSNSPTYNSELMDTSDLPIAQGSEYIPPLEDKSSSVESDGKHFNAAEELLYTSNNKQVKNNTAPTKIISSSLSSPSIENIDSEHLPSVDDTELPVPIVTNKENGSKATATVIPCLGKRSNKKQCCKFCMKLVLKLPRHLMRWHANELEVVKFMKLKPNDKERRNIIEQIRNNGNFIYNYKYCNNTNNSIVKRRPAVSEKKAIEYLPCRYCQATLNKTLLHKHVANCKFNILEPRRKWCRVQANSQMLTSLSNYASDVVYEKIVCNMKVDNITEEVKKDYLILKYGSKLYLKHGHEKYLQAFISTKMRELARLIIEIKSKNSKINSLQDIFNPKSFQLLINGVYSLTGFDSNTGKFKIPSLAKKLGQSIKYCSSILLGESIIKGNKPMQEEIENFDRIFDMERNLEVSRNTLATLFME